MTEYTTKSGGEQQRFSSGAQRDTSKGKPRYDLIPLSALRRWADLMARGAEYYGDRNWELGMPASRFAQSGLRHFFQYLEGDRSEDHAAAVLFNIGAMIHFEGTEWDDINGEIIVDDFFYDLLSDTIDDQPELQPADENESLINWDQLKQEVERGKIDSSTVAWPNGYQAPQA